MSNQQRDDEFEPGNRQHAGQNQQGDTERLGDSLSGSIKTGEQGGNQQQAQPGAQERPMPTVPDEESKPLSEEELRLMADTMPGDGPGDD